MVRVSSLNERNRKEIALLEIEDEEVPFEPEFIYRKPPD
jgi:hypothetical protein